VKTRTKRIHFRKYFATTRPINKKPIIGYISLCAKLTSTQLTVILRERLLFKVAMDAISADFSEARSYCTYFWLVTSSRSNSGNMNDWWALFNHGSRVMTGKRVIDRAPFKGTIYINIYIYISLEIQWLRVYPMFCCLYIAWPCTFDSTLSGISHVPHTALTKSTAIHVIWTWITDNIVEEVIPWNKICRTTESSPSQMNVIFEQATLKRRPRYSISLIRDGAVGLLSSTSILGLQQVGCWCIIPMRKPRLKLGDHPA